MEKEGAWNLVGAIRKVARAGIIVEFLLAFLVVIPLTVWLAWARRSLLAEQLSLTVFCLSFAWLNVSIVRWQRSLRKLGWHSSSRLAFGLSPRPDDADELEMWRRGKHFCYSFLAVLLSIVGFGIVKWVNGG